MIFKNCLLVLTASSSVQCYHLTNVIGFIWDPLDERIIYFEYVQRHLKLDKRGILEN